jgi:gamma-glutamyl phosphate reductase
VDVLIPRGGAGLIRACVENSTVPVIETGTGNCHIYIDKDADLKMAEEVVFNAKTSRVSVCNACESLVIHKDVAEKALPVLKEKLDTKNVKWHGDETVCNIIADCIPATEEDYGKEYLDYEISVKVVSDIDEAIEQCGDSCCASTQDCLCFSPRIGIEFFRHLRLTAAVNTYNFKEAEFLLSLGVVFGGGRKRVK